MAKHERDRMAVGKQSSHGRHGGNRAGDQHKDDRPQQSSPSAGKDPHRGGRPSGGLPRSS
ncbi:hypothetical protein [Devosia nitrariae]|uniref:hypothetical protein n=1 Tax=Devosia nitrariae TaxID=2071872 RepID=UPI0024E05986|nr:hypothetical protein [Devosia nitrariae]